MATIGGQNITRAEIRIPRRGDWWADVSTDSGTALVVGARVEIVHEGLTLSGAIVRGGISGDAGRYQVMGRPEWAAEVTPRAYRSTGNVPLLQVFRDLVADVLGADGASLVVLPADKKLGEHYERPGSDASRGVTVRGRDVLEALGLPWYVRADGVTVFAERTSGSVASTASVRLRERNRTTGLRIVGTEQPEAFVPGLALDGEVIAEVVHRISRDDFVVDVWSEAGWFATAVQAVLRRVAPDLWWRGVYTYRVVGAALPQASDPQWWRYDLRPVNARWLPEARSVSFWPGSAGHHAELRAGSRVLLAFADADLASPVVVNVEPSPGPSEIGRPLTATTYSVDEVHRCDTFDTLAGTSADVVSTVITLRAGQEPRTTVTITLDKCNVDDNFTVQDPGVDGPVYPLTVTPEFFGWLGAIALYTSIPIPTDSVNFSPYCRFKPFTL